MNFHSNMPGAYIKGIIESILNEKDFVKRILNFAVSVTNYIELLLKRRENIQKFRLSYLKVMWKDISIMIWTLHSCQFIMLHELDIKKIIMDFKSEPHSDQQLLFGFPFMQDKDMNKIKLAFFN